jgi:hypothetical protein
VGPRRPGHVIARPLNFTVRAHMKRPREVTALARILTFLGVCAFLGMAVLPWRPLPIAPQLLPLGEPATRWLLIGTATLYSVTSLGCAFAMRRMRSYASVAYLAFVVSIALYFSVWLFLIRVAKPLGIGIVFFALLGAGLYWGWSIVKSLGAGANAL